MPERIRAELAARADPVRAEGARRYLKTDQPMYGVRVPEVRALVRAAVRDRPPADLAALTATVQDLWDGATHREDRYAALAVLGTPASLRLIDPSLLTLYRHLLVTGAWWDLVDETAHRVGEVRERWPEQTAAVLRDWSRDDDRWVRRCSIIAQLGAKDRTDTELLTDVIDANTADPDFFLRKATGWALQDYARTDPEWVRAFVAARTDRLSPLSVREATKHL